VPFVGFGVSGGAEACGIISRMRTEEIAPAAATRRGLGLAGLRAAVRGELEGLLSPALWAALGALLLCFLLAAQLPLLVAIDAGYEEGVGSDLPFLQRFNTAERDSHGTYRWTADGAQIVVPGLGARPAAVTLRLFPVGGEILASGPETIDVYAGDNLIGRLPIRLQGSAQTLVAPPPPGGALRLTLRSATFSPAGDPRRLGTPLDAVTVRALGAPAPVAPDWGAVLVWLGAVALGWLAARHALREGRPEVHRTAAERPKGGVRQGRQGRAALARPAAGPRTATGSSITRGIGPPAAQVPAVWVLAVGAGLVGLAALLDPPRWAFGARAALAGCAMAYGLAVAARALLPGLARRFDVPLGGKTLGWLALFVAVSFALRYGGRLYPDSMPGDIGFHHNRFNEAVFGLIHILSRNRGVDFPYPPGPYLAIAPLTLLGIHPRTALQLGAAMADAVSAPLVYAIATRVAPPATALLAAGVYVFTAATFMVSWWSFDTHIYTQLFHLLLIAALVWALPAWGAGGARRGRRWAWAAGALLGLVFLGHFGFLINTALLAAGLTAAVWAASWRGAAWARAARWPLTLAVAGAGAFAALTFYSAYIPLFLGQLSTAREGGLTAVAGRGPVGRAVMWDTLWRAGLLTHYGLFPLPLALWGLWLIGRDERARPDAGRRAVLWLTVGSLIVAAVFAALPFITGVTNSPRWMLFIAWVVAVGCAVATERIWRAGAPGRVAVLAMGGLVLANTAWIWLAPMLWRVRPPEPF